MAVETQYRPFRMLLRLYRRRRTREEFGLPARSSRATGPKVTGLRQGDIDWLLGLGFGVFQRIESGAQRPSAETFMRLMDLLGFSEQHVRIAQLDLFGSEPPATAGVPSGRWQEMVDSHGDMAIAIDADGKIVAANSTFVELAASSDQPAPQNWWRWTLVDQAARDNWLLRWKAAWAPRLLTDFMLAGVRHPASGTLAAIRQLVRNDPLAQHIPLADSGIGGHALPFRHNQRGTGRVQPLLAVATAATLITLPFVPDDHDAGLNTAV
ncbi:helix-turn-helix domain-containing protein [Streptomyces sp. BE147]|uniref:helix-turn-helix domain-containing protein n=1 Tax=Streptomyces sp. BE147 TaxID=3002524 RepID=UPI002E7774CD|nr:helix-turn-helix domain-containing protein [Streptomyces sp. BE147]MEE1737045.1 helix-turn-helix domain-containing protein [Streptomyces sp. BE147]